MKPRTIRGIAGDCVRVGIDVDGGDRRPIAYVTAYEPDGSTCGGRLGVCAMLTLDGARRMHSALGDLLKAHARKR